MLTGQPIVPTKAEWRLCESLHLCEEESESLLVAMRRGNAARQAVVFSPRAPQGYEPPFACAESSHFSWLPARVRIPAEGESPTQHADYAAGMYYVLDLSSCWEGAALSALAEAPIRSLDMCAAPGGKSVLLAAQFELRDHIANEVHAARRGILRQNIELCGLPNTRITGLRPDQWGKSGDLFELILVDAPCSGQSLLCKGIKNPGCLGKAVVQGNAKRQRGILLSALHCLAPGGYLLYSTCTYSLEEDERAVAYILRRASGVSACDVPALAAYRSKLAEFPAYRLLPHHGAGAGGFCCLLQRKKTNS